VANRYYVTQGTWADNGRGTVRIVVRIDVPPSTNPVGITWQAAAAERWSRLPVENQVTLWPGEDTVLLVSGAEYEFEFAHLTNRTRPDVVAEMEAAVAVKVTETQTELQDMLSYWGKTDTV